MKPINKKNNIIKSFNVKTPTPLLEFLFAHITNDSKNNIKKLLSRRQVLVNGAPITQFDFMLGKEDVVEISSVSVQRIDPPKGKKTYLDIIYEDEDFLVINKPSGLLSVPSDTEKSLIHMLALSHLSDA